MQYETSRLQIRPFNSSDQMDLFEYLSDQLTVQYEPYHPFTLDAARQEAIYRSHNEEFLAVVLKTTGKVIGNLYFAPRGFDTWEIGYVFNSRYWHHGFATESTQALVDVVFQTISVRRIIADCNPLNLASWHLLERLGFRREGHLVQNIYFKTDEQGKPRWQDTYNYGLLRSEWLTGKAKNTTTVSKKENPETPQTPL